MSELPKMASTLEKKEGMNMNVEETVDVAYLEKKRTINEYWANRRQIYGILEQHVSVSIGFMHDWGELSKVLKRRKHWWQSDEWLDLTFGFGSEKPDVTLHFIAYNENELELARFLAGKLNEQSFSSKIIKRFQQLKKEAK